MLLWRDHGDEPRAAVQPNCGDALSRLLRTRPSHTSLSPAVGQSGCSCSRTALSDPTVSVGKAVLFTTISRPSTVVTVYEQSGPRAAIRGRSAMFTPSVSFRPVYYSCTPILFLGIWPVKRRDRLLVPPRGHTLLFKRPQPCRLDRTSRWRTRPRERRRNAREVQHW